MAKFFGKKWELDTTNKYSRHNEKGIIWSVPDESEVMPLKIAQLYYSSRINKEVLRANGRLIAAAPEMYELLSDMLKDGRLFAADEDKVIPLLIRIDGSQEDYINHG